MTDLKRACSRCAVEKPRDDVHFLRIARSTDGLSYHCRECHQAYRRKTKPTGNGNVTAAWQKWFDSQGIVSAKITADHRRMRDPVGASAWGLRRSLCERVRGTAMTVAPEMRTVSHLRRWLTTQPRCECCNVQWDHGLKGGRFTDASPSLDRFDLTKGYTLSNTALVCWRCNNIKRNYHEADLRQVADWMERRRSGTAIGVAA